MATGFVADQSSPYVDNVPAFVTGSSLNGARVTTTFLNMTSQVTVGCSGSSLKIGVTDGGVTGTAYFFIAAGGQVTLDIQTKQIVVAEATGSATAVFSICASLARLESQNFDAPTTANGFEKV